MFEASNKAFGGVYVGIESPMQKNLSKRAAPSTLDEDFEMMKQKMLPAAGLRCQRASNLKRCRGGHGRDGAERGRKRSFSSREQKGGCMVHHVSLGGLC